MFLLLFQSGKMIYDNILHDEAPQIRNVFGK